VYLQNALSSNFWVEGMSTDPNSRPFTCTPECLERMAETTVRFQQTLQELLFLCRPFSFS
jgi:hypothetical protein